MEATQYIGFFFYLGLMIFAGLFFVAFSHLAQVRVKKDVYDWSRPYECGIRTEGLRWDRYPIHYYIVAIMFVIFDVETVFMVPWAVVGNEFKAVGNHVFWFVEMLVFLIILIIGFVYLLQNNVFNWGREEEAD